MAEVMEPRWRQEQEVEWQKVNPYIIARLVDQAGNIHIDQHGHFHVFWHRERLVNGEVRRYLIHHGGPDGFADLDQAKHQHERVIYRYVGLKVDIPPEQVEEGVIPQATFPDIAQRLSVEIPGEQQMVLDWIDTLQKTNRDLPHIRTNGELSQIREGLQDLLEGNLGRSVNRYKRAAAANLMLGIQRGSREPILLAVNQAQMELLMRAHQIVSITLGTMRRYNSLEALQIYYNGLLDSVTFGCAKLLRNLSNAGYPQEYLERMVNTEILHEHTGIEAKLASLKGEPYFSRASQFIDELSPIERLWEQHDKHALEGLLTQQVRELEIWRRRVKSQVGVDFGKYNLPES